MKSEREIELEEALRRCVKALYGAIAVVSLDRLPCDAADAIQHAQAVLGENYDNNRH